jgi:glutamyl-Q tRNA(Asp) synthetase
MLMQQDSNVHPVFRFAPSPNGFLHLGHALSALINYDAARATGGRFLLRIEDIDPARCRSEYEKAIYEDLNWLGIDWERPVRRQSDHFEEYRAILKELEKKGLIYPAFESRTEIMRFVSARTSAWPRDPDGTPLYSGNASKYSAAERKRKIESGKPYALRLNLNAVFQGLKLPPSWIETGNGEPREINAKPERWGDVILARKETSVSYHLAVVIDDAVQGITHILRGLDLYESTSIHRLLQEILSLPVPIYHHHRLILDINGKKLAKRDPSTTLRDLRLKGWTAADVRHAVGQLPLKAGV